MIRTGRGPYLPSIGIGAGLLFVFVFLAAALFVLAALIFTVLNVAVLALLVAAPAAVLLGSFGFLHLDEDDSGFVDDGSEIYPRIKD